LQNEKKNKPKFRIYDKFCDDYKNSTLPFIVAKVVRINVIATVEEKK
jgi:hypothetical protein